MAFILEGACPKGTLLSMGHLSEGRLSRGGVICFFDLAGKSLSGLITGIKAPFLAFVFRVESIKLYEIWERHNMANNQIH